MKQEKFSEAFAYCRYFFVRRNEDDQWEKEARYVFGGGHDGSGIGERSCVRGGKEPLIKSKNLILRHNYAILRQRVP